MFRDKKVLGIDIGSQNIKLALIKQGSQPELMAWAMVPTPINCVQDGMILNNQALAEEIKKVIKEHKLTAQKAAVNLNASSIVVRELRLPALEDKEIKPAVRFGLSQSFPDIIQTHSLAFKIYNRTSESLEGITTLCPRKIIEDYQELAEKADISLKYLDVNANSLAKAYKSFVDFPQTGNSALLVDIRTNMSQVNVLQEGKIILSRNVTGGLASVDSLVEKYFNMAPEEIAAARLNGYQNLSLGREEIDACIRIGYAFLEDLIRQTLEFCSYNKVKEGINSISLCGSGSVFPGLESYFSAIFNLPVHLAQAKHVSPEASEQFYILLPAIGAALRED
ncbi:type IV pilus assembly protein PilM [Desulfitobacterium sp. Sab5]|uniref:type IV pilus assembly protein PilM n=1 Tax=Desulfitobacterium nosdiversum TaxID=3375356 RepID=UPI003CF7A624